MSQRKKKMTDLSMEQMAKLSKIIEYPNGSVIYLTGLSAFSNMENLRRLKIKTVISILSEVPELPSNVFKQYFISIDDSPNAPISNYFESCYSIILNSLRKGERILIHCRAGVSRSTTIIIAFFLRTFRDQLENIFVLPYIPKTQQKWTDSILDFIRKSRPFVLPNPGFMTQLYLYETHCRRVAGIF